MRRLGELGVAIDDVTDALERQGLDAFVADCEALLATLDDRLASAEG